MKSFDITTYNIFLGCSKNLDMAAHMVSLLFLSVYQCLLSCPCSMGCCPRFLVLFCCHPTLNFISSLGPLNRHADQREQLFLINKANNIIMDKNIYKGHLQSLKALIRRNHTSPLSVLITIVHYLYFNFYK